MSHSFVWQAERRAVVEFSSMVGSTLIPRWERLFVLHMGSVSDIFVRPNQSPRKKRMDRCEGLAPSLGSSVDRKKSFTLGKGNAGIRPLPSCGNR